MRENYLGKLKPLCRQPCRMKGRVAEPLWCYIKKKGHYYVKPYAQPGKAANTRNVIHFFFFIRGGKTFLCDSYWSFVEDEADFFF